MKAEAQKVYEPVVQSIREKVVEGVRGKQTHDLMWRNADQKMMRGCIYFVWEAVCRLDLRESLSQRDRDLLATLLYEWIAPVEMGGLGTFYEAAAGVYRPYSDDEYEIFTNE